VNASHSYQYLESLDSAYTPWEERSRIAVRNNQSAHELQVYIEVLMALILGRYIIVPRPYAFDSWGFLSAARTVLDARGNAAASEHPFRMHLPSEDSTYEEAVNRMLRRSHSSRRPFTSSLLPELHDREKTPSPPKDIHELLQSEWLGDERADALATVSAELNNLPAVRSTSYAGGPKVPDILNQITDPSSGLNAVIRNYDETFRQVHSDLTAAIKSLDPRHSEGFKQRGRLRRQGPWPGDHHRRSAEDIVGQDGLILVTEFVDTLYNAVVAKSIGVAPVTFTTDLAIGGRSLQARAIAQDIALNVFSDFSHFYPTPQHARLQEMETAEPVPLFEVRFAENQMSDPQVQDRIRRLIDDSLDGLSALLEHRADHGDGTGSRSTFWKSIDKLKSALREGDQTAARKALDSHLGLVSTILGRHAEAALGPGWKVELLLTGGSAASTTEASSIWHLPGLETTALAALGAIAAPAAGRGIGAVRQWHQNHRFAHALGKVVTIQARS
jgi:hypothetical protein